MGDLTERQATILELEESWWKYEGAKATVIHERLGVTATRYYLELNQLLDDAAALQHAPLTVNRLRRLRDQRRRARTRS